MPIDISNFIGKTYRIMPSWGQDCLTVDNANEDGVPVVLLPFGAGQGQEWQLLDAGAGQCNIRSTLSGKVLDVRDASADNFAPIIQHSMTGRTNQLWTLEPANDEEEGYTIFSVNSGKVLGISPLRIFPQRVAQMDRIDGQRQAWILREV